ncbi:MAG: prealbumin-like fold domain-containing protein [Vicinamibacterales bacterium]
MSTLCAALLLASAARAAQSPLPAAGTQAPQSPSGANPQATPSITGTVTTAERERFCSAACSVSLLTRDGVAASYTSDGDGSFHFDNLALGTYTIVAVLEGFDLLSLNVIVAGGPPVIVKADSADRVRVGACRRRGVHGTRADDRNARHERRSQRTRAGRDFRRRGLAGNA